MTESKSMFAKRIKKPIWWVSKYCKRGILPMDIRGFVFVDEGLKRLQNRKRGRPKVPRPQQIIPVRVLVRRCQKKMIKELARELRKN